MLGTNSTIAYMPLTNILQSVKDAPKPQFTAENGLETVKGPR